MYLDDSTEAIKWQINQTAEERERGVWSKINVGGFELVAGAIQGTVSEMICCGTRCYRLLSFFPLHEQYIITVDMQFSRIHLNVTETLWQCKDITILSMPFVEITYEYRHPLERWWRSDAFKLYRSRQVVRRTIYLSRDCANVCRLNVLESRI